ncbi:MAG: sodium/proline symporter PutP [Oscillospiraceae bacterium]
MEINALTIVAFVLYALMILAIGIYSFKKSKSMSDYFIGGRLLGPWTTAISAQASDMSGWLLMGLPGAVLVSGLTESWIAIGLFIGTYLNWRLLAARLRKMSYAAGDAITIPEYLQKRFFTQSPVVRLVCAAIISVFFLIYTASAFSAGAKLFNFVFGTPYTLSLTIGALIIISYTFLGGFFAVCYTDLIQGILMFAALVVVPIVAICNIPDIAAAGFITTDDAKPITEYYASFIRNANGEIAWTTILSGLAWGLGYFGMPHILVRFMAIKSSDMIKKSRIIATVWVFVTLAAAVLVGILGNMWLGSHPDLMAKFSELKDTEKIFMFLSSSLLPALIAGVVLSAILAAIMSTADSQLLVTASAVTNDMFALFNKKASQKTMMWISRGTVIGIAVIAYFIALDPNSSVMGLVSYAWAGLGAAFGPAMLLSLFWKRMTISGAVAGAVVGGASVIVWETIPFFGYELLEDGARKALTLSSQTGLYSLIPAFFLAAAAIIIVSLMTKVDSKKVEELFAKAKAADVDAAAEAK